MVTRVALTTLILVSLAGCPFVDPVTREFTSADTLAQGRLGDLFPAMDGAGAEDTANGAPEDAAREVVEPDVIRQVGSLLYVLNQYRGLIIVDLDSEELLAQIPTYGFPRDLYFVGNRAYVLVAQATDYNVDGDKVNYSIGSRLYVVDVSSPSEAAIVQDFALEGDLVDSRLVGDVLYAVGSEYEWIWYDAVAEVAKQQSNQSWITSINIADENHIVAADQIAFDGAGTVIQASPDAIFVATPQWADNTTTITYVDISDPVGALAVRGAVNVPGNVADRFKMDSWEGVLRVVSSGWGLEGRNVYVTTIALDNPDELAPLAELTLEDAFNETLFATRFDGPRGYIVTYFVVDPLFVLDLSDPAQPMLLGSVEVPGWSTHIEPDGDRLVTLGVDNTDGRQVSVSIFDVSGVPERVAHVAFGENWAWSSAYDDVKAFTVLDDLIVVPFSGWNGEYGGYDRLQLISRDGDSLTLEGTIDLQGQGVRSFEYGTRLYGVTQEELAVVDAADRSAPEVVNRVALAEDVADVLELGNGRWAEVIRKNNRGETVVRALDGAGVSQGEVVLELGNLDEVHRYGDGVVLVGTNYGYYYVYDDAPGAAEAQKDKPGYMVAYVELPESGPPSVAFQTDVEVQPYYGFIWWPYDYAAGMGGVDVAVSIASDVAFFRGPDWYPFTSDDRSFVVGDMLALRCYAEDYDDVLGDVSASEGLALVALDSGAWTATLGLGAGSVVSLNQSGSQLVLGTKEELPGTQMIWPECAYYVQMLDVNTRTLGAKANVPGTFVQYDAGTNVLLLRDQQWQGLVGNVETTLRTVQWDGSDSIVPLDEVSLPDSTYRVVGEGSRVYLERYDETGYAIVPVAIADDGGLEMEPGLVVSDQWGSLVDAQGNDAYVSLGGHAIARYRFGAGGGTFDELVPVMGYPSGIRFNPSGPVILMSYGGWVLMSE